VYPTPYFKVRNSWLKSYASLILLALTEAIQHQENARPLEISTTFAGLFGQYIHRVYQRMAVELFQVPLADAQKPDFTLTEEQLAAYDPGKWFTQTELIDTVPDLTNWPTEDQLQPLTNGIAIPNLPVLPRWPSTGTNVPVATAQSAGAGASFARPPGA
jgi:hypothetical protein